jgi:Ser-tRNA(Ala) deacylase AlaX
MNNTEESNSTIPFDHSKPKESITEVQAEASQELFENLNINIKTSQQSGIYIKFK